MASDRRLLAVVAHPDDETFGAGTTLAKYASEGVGVYVVCATRGDVGEIAEGSDATPETLPEVRVAELRAAARVLGVRDTVVLGYRDSGMPGTGDNEHPDAFIKVPEGRVVSDIVREIRRTRPHVVFTMDEGGGYGHPDHVYASVTTRKAFELASDESYVTDQEAWSPASLYYLSFPRSILSRWIEAEKERDPDGDLANLDPATIGVPDEVITTVIDVIPHIDVAIEAMAEHRSQISPIDRLGPKFASDFMSTDYYRRVYPKWDGGPQESGLFDGM